VAGIQWWHRREQLLHKRGTAYVLDEVAEAWTYEEKRSFITALSSHFAAVLQVPGPAELGDAWRWPLGPGAEHWGQKVDDLVRAFWAVHYNDDQETHNALFVWAWWSRRRLRCPGYRGAAQGHPAGAATPQQRAGRSARRRGVAQRTPRVHPRSRVTGTGPRNAPSRGLPDRDAQLKF
jgi:hypothetical protein